MAAASSAEKPAAKGKHGIKGALGVQNIHCQSASPALVASAAPFVISALTCAGLLHHAPRTHVASCTPSISGCKILSYSRLAMSSIRKAMLICSRLIDYCVLSTLLQHWPPYDGSRRGKLGSGQRDSRPGDHSSPCRSAIGMRWLLWGQQLPRRAMAKSADRSANLQAAAARPHRPWAAG